MSRTQNRRSRPVPAPTLDQLEPRIVLSAFSWTSEEVYLAELINRARMDPSAEGARLGIDLTDGLTASELARLVPSEPLALNAELTTAMRAHVLDMAERGFFDHINPDGLDPTDRAQAAGYTGVAGENIAAGQETIDEAHRAWLESVGHRRNVFSLYDTFDDAYHYDEIGIGFAFTDIAPYYDFYGELFGSRYPDAETFILGVIYTDTDGDRFYSIGEGAGQVQVSVFAAGDLTTPIGTYTTDNAGNYQIAVADGDYVVRMTDLLSGGVTSTSLTVAGENVKFDGRTGEFTVLTDDHADDDYAAATLVGLDTSGDAVANGIIETASDADLFRFVATGTGRIIVTITSAADALDSAALLVGPNLLPFSFSTANADGSQATVSFGVVAGQSYYVSVSSSDGSTTGSYTLAIDAPAVGATSNPGDAGLPGDPDRVDPAAAAGGEMSVVVVEQFGLPVVYERDSGGAWTATNLLDAAGGAPAVAAAQSYVDANDGLFYVAVPTDAGLLLYQRDADGVWALRNLTIEDPFSYPIADQLLAFASPNGKYHLAGLDAFGDLVIYTQTGDVLSSGDRLWRMDDIAEDHLRANGAEMPAFTGNLIAYVTSWGGLNIAGLDAAGNIHAVWWAPGLPYWHANNLSDITGAPAYTGELSAYLTDWDGINIAGTDTNGDLAVTWWVPQFGGEWRVSNLTDLFDGPQLDPASITSYVTPWGGLNVGGLDADGDVTVYWWVPGFTDWRISTITVAGTPAPTGELASIATPEGVLNLLGTDSSGDLIRYYWDPAGVDGWIGENISDLAGV